MGIFFSFDDDEELQGGVGWWFTHLFEHLALPFVTLYAGTRDWLGRVFKKKDESIQHEDDSQLLFRGLHDDKDALERFLEKENIPADAKHWLVLAGFDPTAPTNDDSPRELQVKYVMRECRPECYFGEFPVVDAIKLKYFLETPEAKRVLDPDFYASLSTQVSSAWVEWRERSHRVTMSVDIDSPAP